MSETLTVEVSDTSVHNAICGGLRRLYFENKLFDVILITYDDEIPAHKIVLASAATFFKLLFTSELTSRSVSSVDVSFCDTKILKQIIHFIYTGEITLNQKNIVSLVELEDFLGLGLIHHHLSHYMLTTINDYNCWSYHEVAGRHGYNDAFAKVDSYIRKNFTRLISTGRQEFLNVCAQQLLTFFSSDFLAVPDQERLLLSLCQWMGASPEDRLCYLEELVSQVDVGRIRSWRGMSDRLAAYFSENYQAPIIDWADSIVREMINRKLPLKGAQVEVVLLIGGLMGGTVVPTVDTFIPPILLSRVLPLSVDHKQHLVIPPMFERRYKPTAAASTKAVYVIGGTHNHEELKINGISCEVYKLEENKWSLLPNLPHSKTLKVSTNRRAPAVFVEGNLYAALPSPKPSFWMLSRNEKVWTQLEPMKCYEVYDLVNCCSAVYCIGRQYRNSTCYLLERYDSYADCWVEVSVFFVNAINPRQMKAICLNSCICVASCQEWVKFEPSTGRWERMNIILSESETIPAFCTYKDRQIISLKDVPCLEVASVVEEPLTVIVLQQDDEEEEEVAEEEIVDDDQSKIICNSCGAEFAEEAELHKHSSSCTSDLEFECAICGAIFVSEYGLRIHVRIHSDGSTCEKCGKHFRQGVNMETHQRQECGQEPPLECNLCDARFHFKAQLNAHLIDSHSEAKLVDPQHDLINSQLEEEQYQCKLCPRSFTRVGSLNYHVSRKHSGDSERSAEEFPYLCFDCNNRYKSGTQLCRHRRWECGKEPMFKCQMCVKKFHHRHGLKQHIRLHLAKRTQQEQAEPGSRYVATAQFCCEKCGRGYKLKSSLNNHIKWECGKEPVFPCSVCHVRFSHKGNLKKHILTKHVSKQALQTVGKQK